MKKEVYNKDNITILYDEETEEFFGRVKLESIYDAVTLTDENIDTTHVVLTSGEHIPTCEKKGKLTKRIGILRSKAQRSEHRHATVEDIRS